MGNSLSLGKIVSGDSLFEVSLELHDVSGTQAPLPKVSAQVSEQTRKIAQQIFAEYGKKFQGTHGTPESLSDEGFQAGNITIQHKDANTQLIWNQFKRVLIGGAPALGNILATRPFGLRMSPLSPKEYYPRLETIRHKLESTTPLTREEENELQWFGEITGRRGPQSINAYIIRYFRDERPSLVQIYKKMEDNEAFAPQEQEKFEVFQAWYRQQKVLERAPLAPGFNDWQGALRQQIRIWN